jgi:hypothetical protein
MNWNIFKSQVEKDAEVVLQDLQAIYAQVQAGTLNKDLLNAVTLLQPLLAIIEKDFPAYAPVIAWVNNLLQDALKANQPPTTPSAS